MTGVVQSPIIVTILLSNAPTTGYEEVLRVYFEVFDWKDQSFRDQWEKGCSHDFLLAISSPMRVPRTWNVGVRSVVRLMLPPVSEELMRRTVWGCSALPAARSHNLRFLKDDPNGRARDVLQKRWYLPLVLTAI